MSHEYGPRNNLPHMYAFPMSRMNSRATAILVRRSRRLVWVRTPRVKVFKSATFRCQADVDDARFARRRSALDAVNEHFARKDESDSIKAMNTFYERAYSLVASNEARNAFKIEAEPEAIRKNTA